MAVKQITFEALPRTLMVQLNRFAYDRQGHTQKMNTKIRHGAMLEIPHELISPLVRAQLAVQQRSYRLVAGQNMELCITPPA